MPLNAEIRKVRLGDLVRQDVNARFMRKEQYDTLVANVRKDGLLTSVPLAYQPAPEAPIEIISGHHRHEAALEVFGADAEIDVMVVLDEQSRQEIIARQISHNAIAGEDDLATLKQMYDQLDDVDWRSYSGVDDKLLELMEQVDLSSLAEAQLDYATIQLLFLPAELEQATQAFDVARKLVQAEQRWVAGIDQYEPTLRALESVRDSYSIGNVATTWSVILDVFEENLTALRAGWYNPEDHTAKHSKWVPLETIFGSRMIPAEAGAIILHAMRKAAKDADLDPKEDAPWRSLELIAADYLGNA